VFPIATYSLPAEKSAQVTTPVGVDDVGQFVKAVADGRWNCITSRLVVILQRMKEPKLTILKASFFLLEERAIICESWLNVILVISVVKFISSRIGFGEAPANNP
jgi:hypothetical protein